MLSNLVVSFYYALLEISMWLILVIGVYGGWAWGGANDNVALGSIMGLLLAFIFNVTVFGLFLTVGDIRKSVRAIEENNACKA